MSVIRIASRYAKSLLDLSKEQNVLEEVYGDIEGFVEVASNRDFELMVKSPIINSSKKLSIFNEIFDGKVNNLTKEFFNIVIRKGREPILIDIAKSFIKLYKEANKITEVKVISAAPIGDDGIEDIKKKLKESGVSTQNIEISTEIDESLIGGFVILVGDKRIDASVAQRLKNMSQALIS